MITEAQADKAIATLKRAINAAENSNQAGEDAVVAMAAGPSMLAALRSAHDIVSDASKGIDVRDWPEIVAETLTIVEAAIAKATGQEGGAL